MPRLMIGYYSAHVEVCQITLFLDYDKKFNWLKLATMTITIRLHVISWWSEFEERMWEGDGLRCGGH